eukprot:GGOE01017799.1.p1 GENE.GGOE01017799.1~~GGOE01017799.1.p1  ORF type:complete len:419 (+),score=114.70 GGOE01017799.1:40-1257(+)
MAEPTAEVLVRFGPVLNTDDFKVLEVSDAILADLRRADCPLVFKGCVGEPLVLCSAAHTHELRSLESSNTLLLACTPADPAAPLAVEGSITHHYECRPQPPNVRKLKRLLSECYYTSDGQYEAQAEPLELRVTDSFWDPTQAGDTLSSSLPLLPLGSSLDLGPARQKQVRTTLHTRDSLRSQVLCSDGELDAALAELNPIVTRLGHVLLPAPDTVTACLDSLLTIAEGNWDVNRFSTRQCLAELKEFYSAPLIVHVLNTYCSLVEGDDGDDGEQWWSLDAPKVCRFRATQLFQANPKWKESELMAQWGTIVPTGMKPSLDMLHGYVVLQHEGALRMVRWFPRDELPPDPRQRFAKLFECQKKWSKAEIVPFLSDLAGPGLTVEQLLTRHAREHQEAGGPHYCRAF